jgi:hypothetical protein
MSCCVEQLNGDSPHFNAVVTVLHSCARMGRGLSPFICVRRTL